MIWRRKDPEQNHFVTFSHHDDLAQRLAALESDLSILAEVLSGYIDADIEAPWLPAAKRLSSALHRIMERIERQAKP